MAARGSSPAPSSPARAASHPTARRLDFEQDESSLQETPALSGSGARRGKRSDVYDIPEDGSPVPEESVLEESLVPEETTQNEDSVMINVAEESFVGQVGEDTVTGAEAVEDWEDLEESEIAPEPVKEPIKKGRKRKSDAVEASEEEQAVAEKPRKGGPATAQASETQKKSKKSAPAPAVPRRSQRVSDVTEQEPSIIEAPADTSIDQSEQTEEVPIAPKRRGRPPRIQPDTEKENSAPAKPAKNAPAKEKTDAVFKKPAKPMGRPPKVSAEPKSKPAKADPKSKPAPKAAKEKTPQPDGDDGGKLVDVHGNPLSKKDIDQMSATSAGSRFGRGRHLSVFREIDPDEVARIGRTGRHRVAPLNFWKNDRISYDTDGSMTSIVKSADPEEQRRPNKKSSYKSKKKSLIAIEEEEIELDPWEEEEGTLVGNYRGFDPATDVSSTDIIEDSKSRLISTPPFPVSRWRGSG
jgi:centromere protein C